MLNLLGVKIDRLRGINRTTGIFSGSCFLIAFYICCIICPDGICVYRLSCEFRKYHVCLGDYQETASPSKKTRSQFGCTHVIWDTLPSYLVYLVLPLSSNTCIDNSNLSGAILTPTICSGSIALLCGLF